MPARYIFISYSSQDAKFAEKLENRLKVAGFEVYRDVPGIIAGPLEVQLRDKIDKADALLLIFSKNSAGSDWVEWEVQTARDREKKDGINLLCPISLDEDWTKATWRGPLMNQIKDYAILDFSKPRRFEAMFERLREGLAR